MALTSEVLPDDVVEPTRLNLSTARLVDGDGDVTASFGRTNSAAVEAQNDDVQGGPGEVSSMSCAPANKQDPATPDAVPDWVVGELRSTDQGQGARALVLSTTLRPSLVHDTVDPRVGPENVTSWVPTSEEKARGYLRSQYYLLPSYALRAVSVVDPTGSGWAVGARGALMRLGGSSAGSEGGSADLGEPPTLGQPKRAPLPERSPFDALRPAGGGVPGLVPALAERPVDTLPEPRLMAMGSPDPSRPFDLPPEDIGQIVMSRDGSEGWALGATSMVKGLDEIPGTTTLYRYSGGSWSRCDAVGIPHVLEADPACSRLARLLSYENIRGTFAGVRITAATRVPLENDDDPSNDDEFEVIAVGSKYGKPGQETERFVLLRYRYGRWALDDDETVRELMSRQVTVEAPEPTSVVFTSPDDGWIQSAGYSGTHARLIRYHDGAWTLCITAADLEQEDCADPAPHRTLFTDPVTGDVDAVTGMVAAGRRVYLFGARNVGGTMYPLVLYRDEGGVWSADPAGGGYDPGAAVRAGGTAPVGVVRGIVDSLAVAATDHGLEGWAVGKFNGRPVTTLNSRYAEFPGPTALLRLEPGRGWQPASDAGPVGDYVRPMLEDNGSALSGSTRPGLQIQVADGRAFFAQPVSGRLFGFDPERQTWRLVEPERSAHPGEALLASNPDGRLEGQVQALAPDGQGGFWAAMRQTGDALPLDKHDDFFHYTSRAPRPVFEETASPLDDPVGSTLTALTGGPDGSVWAASNSGTVYRYDRLTGWDRVTVSGWDPGRVVTDPSPAYAIAVGPDGQGVVVGRRGRIADLDTSGVSLDAVAGTVCGGTGGGVERCGTSRDLRAAAVAPDGAAMVGGNGLALLWRPAGGAFRAIAKPSATTSPTITGIALPAADRAWLTTKSGLVYAGELEAGSWSWRLESLDARGFSLARDQLLNPLPLRAIAIDAAGHGYAVGDRGLLLERSPGEQRPWRRVKAGFLDSFTAVTLGPNGAPGALIGGRNGLVLTLVDGRWQLARPADSFSLGQGEITGPVVGLVWSAGPAQGSAEAWMATAASNADLGVRGDGIDPNRAVSQVFHYSSDPSDPLLDGGAGRAEPRPDSPLPRPGELRFAAFGKTECRHPAGDACFDMDGSRTDYQVLASRVVAEIARASGGPDGPAFALFTGDAVDTAGTSGYATAEPTAPVNGRTLIAQPTTHFNGPRKQRRWREFVAEPLADAGVPFFGAIGGQDLSDARACYGTVCVTTKQAASAGENFGWRASLAGQAAPWGTGGGPAPESHGVSFEPVDFGSGAVFVSDQKVADPTGGEATDVKASVGGARTHYAVDAVRDGKRVVRVVVVDSSFGSLAASDGAQNPVAAGGGQLVWLQDVLCQAPALDSTGRECSRGADQQAVVVTNTPTYSYGPGAGTATAADAAVLETLLFRHHVNAVVSGKLGWNGLYYATAPGVHSPCPGGTYPDGPPADAGAPCDVAGAGDAPDPTTAAARLSNVIGGGAPPPPPAASSVASLADGQVAGLVPFVVASSAGGKFGPDGTASGSAGEGYWHGYTVVRLDASGDPARTIVEQRPIFDWVAIRGSSHVLRPGQRMTLRGIGREPIGYNSASRLGDQTTQVDTIDSPAITHRYELLEADPQRPYIPRRDANGDYVSLDPTVARIDAQTGQVTTGRSSRERVFAIALLSVGEKAATYPIAFEPRRSSRPPLPPVLASAQVPEVRVLGFNTQAIQPPTGAPPATTPPPIAASLNLPAPPALPGIPPTSATPVATPPAPPVPPPPANQAASALDLSISPVGLTVPPTTGVTAQPTPPVNPSPPSGARKEAKQRQAATAKSEESGAPEGTEGASDLADGPPGASGVSRMTRRDRERARAGSLAAVTHAEQRSAWTTGLHWGGGIGLVALALALSYTTARPTPRRRPPVVPAPAWRQRRH